MPDLPALPPRMVNKARHTLSMRGSVTTALTDALTVLAAEPEAIRRDFARFLHSEEHTACPSCGSVDFYNVSGSRCCRNCGFYADADPDAQAQTYADTYARNMGRLTAENEQYRKALREIVLAWERHEDRAVMARIARDALDA